MVLATCSLPASQETITVVLSSFTLVTACPWSLRDLMLWLWGVGPGVCPQNKISLLPVAETGRCENRLYWRFPRGDKSCDEGGRVAVQGVDVCGAGRATETTWEMGTQA